jgi:hypothetical protein
MYLNAVSVNTSAHAGFIPFWRTTLTSLLYSTMKSGVLPPYTSMSVVRNNFTAVAVPLVDFQEFRYKDYAIRCHSGNAP